MLFLILGLAVIKPVHAQTPLSKNWRWRAWRDLAPYTYNLPDPDAVELHRFAPGGPDPVEEPDPTKIKIVNTKRFTGRQARRISQLWRNQDFWISYSAACHEPAYGLTVYQRGKKVFFASICFKCHNIYFYGEKRETTGIDPGRSAYRSLQKLFTDIWPDPTTSPTSNQTMQRTPGSLGSSLP